MNSSKLKSTLLSTLIIAFVSFTSCKQKENITGSKIEQVDDRSVLQKEIELRLREFENHLQNGDSMALGDMYFPDAVIMPSTIGKDRIIKNFGSMIRDSITGSSFKTTDLWGNNEMLVEEGTGEWSHQNGQVVGRGKYIVVWKKENGNWKILRDIWFPEKE